MHTVKTIFLSKCDDTISEEKIIVQWDWEESCCKTSYQLSGDNLVKVRKA